MDRAPLLLDTPQEERHLEKKIRELRDEITKREKIAVKRWVEYEQDLGRRPDADSGYAKVEIQAFEDHTKKIKIELANLQQEIGIIQTAKQRLRAIDEAEAEVHRLQGEVQCAEKSKTDLAELQRSIPSKMDFAVWHFNEALRQLAIAKDKLSNLKN
jgi:DNA repair exonuclease SbcCD ATPase subunit